MATVRSAKLIAAIPAVFGLGLLAAMSANAATITVPYGPFDVVFHNTGDTTWDFTGAQDWTATQMADVGASITAWDDMITNTPGRQVVMHAVWYDFADWRILGGSYSPSNGDGTTSWQYGEHVWRDGVNYTGAWTAFDTIIVFDTTTLFGLPWPWSFGEDPAGPSELDFRSIVTHEIGHSLGFVATYDDAGDDWGKTFGTADDPEAFAGYNGLSAWDKNLVDSSGNRPENDSQGTPSDFNETDDPVFWDGANAVAYYNDFMGQPGNVPIYAPSTYAPGSSLSHLDEASFPDLLMGPEADLGPQPRAPSSLEWAMMRDMGWQLGEVPEPGSLVMLAGLAGMSLLWYRRRRRQSS